jgi:hypothetical protein
MRKGSLATGMRLLDYRGSKYHATDKNGRMYLLSFDLSGGIEARLGIGRNLRHRFKRPDRQGG